MRPRSHLRLRRRSLATVRQVPSSWSRPDRKPPRVRGVLGGSALGSHSTVRLAWAGLVMVLCVACSATDPTPPLRPTSSPASPAARTFTGTLLDRRLTVVDESGWLVGVADASDQHFPDNVPSNGNVQGPTLRELFVRMDFCSLTTDIAVRIAPEVSSISVDETFPWPSGEGPPACPDVLGAALLIFDRDVSPPPRARPS